MTNNVSTTIVPSQYSLNISMTKCEILIISNLHSPSILLPPLSLYNLIASFLHSQFHSQSWLNYPRPPATFLWGFEIPFINHIFFPHLILFSKLFSKSENKNIKSKCSRTLLIIWVTRFSVFGTWNHFRIVGQMIDTYPLLLHLLHPLDRSLPPQSHPIKKTKHKLVCCLSYKGIHNFSGVLLWKFKRKPLVSAARVINTHKSFMILLIFLRAVAAVTGGIFSFIH